MLDSPRRESLLSNKFRFKDNPYGTPSSMVFSGTVQPGLRRMRKLVILSPRVTLLSKVSSSTS